MKTVLLPGLLAAATLGLSGCAMYDGFGGVSVGYGDGYYDGYDPYVDGYGDLYYSSGYYGWYDGYYYPGAGYYIYDRRGSRHRWSDRHRDYWETRRGRHEARENWSGYRRDGRWNDRDDERGDDGRRDRRRYRGGEASPGHTPGLNQGARILGARPGEVEAAVRRANPERGRNWGQGGQRRPAAVGASPGAAAAAPAPARATPQARPPAARPERAAPPVRQRTPRPSSSEREE